MKFDREVLDRPATDEAFAEIRPDDWEERVERDRELEKMFQEDEIADSENFIIDGAEVSRLLADSCTIYFLENRDSKKNLSKIKRTKNRSTFTEWV